MLSYVDGGLRAGRPTTGQGHLLHFRVKAAAKREAEAMLHLDEVLKEEIYARGVCSRGQYQRVEGSFETMGFKWRFFLPFFSLLKRKGKHSRRGRILSAPTTVDCGLP